jgi:hypothetical protein
MQGNLISNDPMVSAIFETVGKLNGTPHQKVKALVRAASIASIYSDTEAFSAVLATWEEDLEGRPATP